MFANVTLKSQQTNEIKPTIKLGIDVLKEFEILKGKRVGLITNSTGVGNNLKSTIDILFESPEVNLVALYGPERGVRGNFTAGKKFADDFDEKTKLPVFSLHGKTQKPMPETNSTEFKYISRITTKLLLLWCNFIFCKKAKNKSLIKMYLKKVKNTSICSIKCVESMKLE